MFSIKISLSNFLLVTKMKKGRKKSTLIWSWPRITLLWWRRVGGSIQLRKLFRSHERHSEEPQLRSKNISWGHEGIYLQQVDISRNFSTNWSINLLDSLEKHNHCSHFESKDLFQTVSRTWQLVCPSWRSLPSFACLASSSSVIACPASSPSPLGQKKYFCLALPDRPSKIFPILPTQNFLFVPKLEKMRFQATFVHFMLCLPFSVVPYLVLQS